MQYIRQRFAKLKQCEKELKEAVELKTGKKTDDMVYLDALAVSPSFQRAGYGRLIMDAVQEKVVSLVSPIIFTSI